MKTENNRKTVLITGVSKGIGKSLTKKMLADNYYVIGTSRDGNLKEFENGKIINISSRMGSIDECETADSIAYRMSKSALNMYTKILTNRLEGKVKVASVHPGWVKTKIRESNLVNGTLTPEESAARIFSFITSDFESGMFWNAENEAKILW